MRDYPVQAPRRQTPTLRLYTYRSHCALVGRFQNLAAELNLANCAAEDIQIGRRPTGGGAILMGREQLGLCLTTSSAFDAALAKPREVYYRFAEPLIAALKTMGIQAAFRGKNDLQVNGKKIAGLGVYYDTAGAILFHTSLLVDLDIQLMLRVLNIPAEKYSDKVLVRSVRQRITTVSRELQQPISVGEVRQRVKESFQRTFGITLEEIPFSGTETARIEALAAEKYRNEMWLFQRSPQADMTGMSVKKTAAGLLRTYIGLKGDIIKSVLISGDFLETAPLFNEIETRLKWSPLDKSHIRKTVAGVLSGSEVPLRPEEVVEAIWQAARRARMENHFTYNGSCYYPKAPAMQSK